MATLREMLPVEYLHVYDRLERFNLLIAAWNAKDMRAYLWRKPAAGIYICDTKHMQRHFRVDRYQINHALNWLRHWGWYVEAQSRYNYMLMPPLDYQLEPPLLYERVPSKRKKVKPPKPPAFRRLRFSRPLTVDDITSLQAQGMTMRQIAKHLGVEWSTPYQVLRRAKLRELANA